MPQLVKRFGKSYTVESVQTGKKCKFRSANVSVDVVVANGFSVAETYLSDHPLTASGEPPNDIVQAVLRTNAPKARWVETQAGSFGADYALRSSDDKYIAILKYTGAQPEDSVWIMTVGLAKSVRALSSITSPSANPSPPASTAILTRENITAAIEGFSKVLNVVGFHYLQSTTEFGLVSDLGGAVALIRILDDGVQKKMERIAGLKRGELPADNIRRQRL